MQTFNFKATSLFHEEGKQEGRKKEEKKEGRKETADTMITVGKELQKI